MIEIVHISDLHFGKTKNWTKKVQRFLKKILRKFPFEESRDIRLLVTGDIIDNFKLGKRAWKAQLKLAEEALVPFRSKIIIVPGNHDIGFGGVGYSRACVEYFDDSFLSALGIGYRYRTKRPFTKVLENGNGNKVLLVGLNSCLNTPNLLDIAKGEIGETQRTRLEEILKDPAYRALPKIVCLHHIPHRRARDFGMSLNDYKELMAIVEERVDALAFGHEGAIRDPNRKRPAPPPHSVRPMRVRRAGYRGIKYYLDANACIEEQSCYHITVEGTDVTARLVKL